MRPLILVALLVACSDPTKVAPVPTIGAIAGTVVSHSFQNPVAGVQVTIMSFADSTYTAQDTTNATGMFFQDGVPAGAGEFVLRHLPTGCDSVMVAGFAVQNGLVDSTAILLPCGP
jgi:hypothetical protein